MKRLAIVQSSYIPWKGYFDLIARADELVLLDGVQYTRRDWRNRNRIKTAHGLRWLTIPVAVRGRYLQRIDETRVADPDWAERHWRTISQSYAKAPCYEAYRERIEQLYRRSDETLLTEINERFIRALCELLGIDTPITRSRAGGDVDPSERLLRICLARGATEYVSGPSARDYLDERLFQEAGVSVTYMDYSGYPEYPQLFPPFEHRVSVLDLLLNVGPRAREHMAPNQEVSWATST